MLSLDAAAEAAAQRSGTDAADLRVAITDEVRRRLRDKQWRSAAMLQLNVNASMVERCRPRRAGTEDRQGPGRWRHHRRDRSRSDGSALRPPARAPGLIQPLARLAGRCGLLPWWHPLNHRPAGTPELMARTLLVSPEQRGAFATIRDALAAADPGAVISVAPGDYAESLLIRQQHVTLTARDAGTVTITSPSREDPAVSVVGGQVGATRAGPAVGGAARRHDQGRRGQGHQVPRQQ